MYNEGGTSRQSARGTGRASSWRRQGKGGVAPLERKGPMLADERLEFLRNVPMFAGMDEAELEGLGADLKRRSFAAGRALFYQGDPGSAVYLVRSGRVRIYVHTPDGQEVSVVLCNPGDLFGEMSLLDGRPRSASAVAMEDSELLVMSGQDFVRHVHDSHQLALNVMLTLSARLRDTTEAVKSLASLDVNRRVVKKLLFLARRQGGAYRGRDPHPRTPAAARTGEPDQRQP